MTSTVSEASLSQLSDLMTARTGLHFTRERWNDLRRGIRSAATEFGFNDVASCVHWLLSSPLTREQIEILASHLTVGETYFFREKKTFEALEESIFPELIRRSRTDDRRLRIWSAGCATGEEAYSIAILLSKLVPDFDDWNVAILATDINPRFLKKALRGVYGEWSFRDCPRWVKEKYFRKTKDHRFEIMSYIKKMATFFHHNLVEDPYPSLTNNTNAMDVIFCRNVLMYFAEEKISKVIQGFYDCLTDDGWLIVSPTEISQLLYSQFTAVNFSGATLYRKDSRRSRTARGFIPETIMPQTVPKTVNVHLHPSSTTSPEQATDFRSPVASIKQPLRETEKPKPEKSKTVTYEQALALYERGFYGEAEEKLAALPPRNREDPRAIILLARVYANQGKLSEAVDCCRTAITEEKLNPVYYYIFATILQEQNQHEEAIKSLKRALYVNQDFALAHFALGNLTLRQRKLQESRRHFENALSVLSKYKSEDILPESEGMTAGRLAEIIRSTTFGE